MCGALRLRRREVQAAPSVRVLQVKLLRLRKSDPPSRPCDSAVFVFNGGQLFVRLSDGSRWRAKDGCSLEIRNFGGGEIFTETFDLLEDGPEELRRGSGGGEE